MSTIAQMALHLDLSERRFRELVDEGVIPRAARGETARIREVGWKVERQ